MQRHWVVPSSVETAGGAQDAGAWGQDHGRGRWADVQAKTCSWELLPSPDAILDTRGPLKVLKAKERHAQSHSPIHPHGLPSGSHSLFRGHGRRPEGQAPSGQRSGMRTRTPRATGGGPAPPVALGPPGLTAWVAQLAACSYSVGWYLLWAGTRWFMNLGGRHRIPRSWAKAAGSSPGHRAPGALGPDGGEGPPPLPSPLLPSPPLTPSLYSTFFGLSSILSQIPKVKCAKYQVSRNSLAVQ